MNQISEGVDMLESVEKLRKTAYECTQIAGIEDKFETVWITKAAFTQMLDDIEHEHGKKLHDATCKAHSDGERSAMKQLRSASEDYRRGYEQGFSDADLKVGSDLRGLGYIKLPTDRNGEVIYPESTIKTWGAIDYMKVHATADGGYIWIVIGHDSSSPVMSPKTVEVYHEPTVEDVLREFTDAILEWAGKSGSVADVGTWSDVAAEYAERLQLKESE